MTDQKEPVERKVALGEPRAAVPRITRRRFTKAGMVAPLIMTLGSRPVWGQTCSFSGQLSGNGYTTEPPMGIGHPPSYWRDSYFVNPNIGSASTGSTRSQDSLDVQENKTSPNLASQEAHDQKQIASTEQNTDWPDVDIDTQIRDLLGTFDTCDFFGNATFSQLLKLNSKNISLDDDLNANAAAALLGILKGGYGYGIDGLMDFLCSAAKHAEAVDVLICLNNRPSSGGI